MTKMKVYQSAPPQITNLNEANVLIQEFWGQLREYEDKLAVYYRNSSLSPSSDSHVAKAERKSLNN